MRLSIFIFRRAVRAKQCTKIVMHVQNWNHPISRIGHFELIKCILFYLKSVLIEVIVRENMICVKNGMLRKQLAIYEILREMNTAEY